jgi:hypothetical protein
MKLLNIYKKEKDYVSIFTKSGMQYAINKTGKNWVVSAECQPEMFKSTRLRDCMAFIEKDVIENMAILKGV